MQHTLSSQALDQLFVEARTHNGWKADLVPDETIRRLYEMIKYGPASANCSPARFIFIRTAEAKELLAPALSRGNLDKTMAAPVDVIVSYDQLPNLFPHTYAQPWFTRSPAVAEETAFRNGTLQGGYLIMATRALGLDCSPMSGFDRDKVDATFLKQTTWRSNFLVNLGVGDSDKLFGQLPRLEFNEVCRLC